MTTGRPNPPRLIKTGVRIGGFCIGPWRFATRPEYETDEEFEYDGIRVPKGFKTDLVSAPWFLRPFMPLKHMAIPAILHDILRRLFPWLSCKETDKRFRRYMKEFGVAQPWRTLAYWGVRTNKNRA